MFTLKRCFIIFYLIHLASGLPILDENNSVQKTKRDVNFIQEKLIKTLNPQPILDTISEAEKCCNNVQHEFGKKAVDAYDQLSQFLLSVYQFPQQKATAIGKQITEILNIVGGKLVGLQK